MTPPLDLNKYRHHVERFDMPEEQKAELLRVVWHIMESFVDRAFGLDAVQISGAQRLTKGAGGEAPVLDLQPVVKTPNRLGGAFRASTGSGPGRKP